MISIEQIRAGRALLGLSQKELAQKAGLSLNSLNNIERDVASPKADSLKAIQCALAEDGVEFLENHGVCLKGERLEIEKMEGQGQDLLQKFYDDMLRELAGGNAEILYMGLDNTRADNREREKLRIFKQFEQEIFKRNITERLLFLEGDTNFLSDINVYRWIPKELFSQIPVAIYGETIAIILWGPPSRLMFIRNESIAETFRKQFEAMWSLAKPVPDDIHEKHKVKDEDWK